MLAHKPLLYEAKVLAHTLCAAFKPALCVEPAVGQQRWLPVSSAIFFLCLCSLGNIMDNKACAGWFFLARSRY